MRNLAVPAVVRTSTPSGAEQGAGPLRPPLRWAGGKRSLSAVLMGLMPTQYHRYVEPMAGSAALFFAIRPATAVLGDLNGELVNYYSVLRDSPDTLIASLRELPASVETYYRLRSFRPTASLQQAIRFAYLNRLCWNGLYRVNLTGRFNVPIGSRLPRTLWDEDHLRECSQCLQAAEVRVQDAIESVAMTVDGDFLFLDPPYPKGAPGVGFNRYTPKRFSHADHRLLSAEVHKATERGVRVMVVMSALGQFTRHYESKFLKYDLTTKSLIACTAAARGSWSECVFVNYVPGVKP